MNQCSKISEDNAGFSVVVHLAQLDEGVVEAGSAEGSSGVRVDPTANRIYRYRQSIPESHTHHWTRESICVARYIEVEEFVLFAITCQAR